MSSFLNFFVRYLYIERVPEYMYAHGVCGLKLNGPLYHHNYILGGNPPLYYKC